MNLARRPGGAVRLDGISPRDGASTSDHRATEEAQATCFRSICERQEFFPLTANGSMAGSFDGNTQGRRRRWQTTSRGSRSPSDSIPRRQCEPRPDGSLPPATSPERRRRNEARQTRPVSGFREAADGANQETAAAHVPACHLCGRLDLAGGSRSRLRSRTPSAVQRISSHAARQGPGRSPRPQDRTEVRRREIVPGSGIGITHQRDPAGDRCPGLG